jgi:hypothetical protein
VKTPDTDIATVFLEAEEGELSGRVEVTGDQRAENARLVRFPNEGDPGELSVTFEVPHDGEYAVWAYVYNHTGSADPLVVHLDEEVKMPWRVRVPGRCWGWDFVGGEGRFGKKRWNRNDGHVNANPLLLRLKRGRHTLKLVSSEGHGIDRVVVTNDPCWDKTGFDALRGGH